MSTLRRTLQRLRLDRSRSKDERRQREEQEQAERWYIQDEEAKERLLKEAENTFQLKVAEDSVTEYNRQRDINDVFFRGIWEAKNETKKLANAEPVTMEVDFSNDGFEYADFEAYGMVRYHMFGEDIVPNGPDQSVRNQIPSNLYGSKYGRHPYIIPDDQESSSSDAGTSSQPEISWEFPKCLTPMRESTPFDDDFSRSPPLTEGCFDDTDFEFSSENLLEDKNLRMSRVFQSAIPKLCSTDDNYHTRRATASTNSENLTEEDRSPRRLTPYRSCVFASSRKDEETVEQSTLFHHHPDSSDSSSSFSPNWTSASEHPSPTTEKPSPTTEKPSPTTEKPSPTTEKPSPFMVFPTCVDEPSSSQTSFSPNWTSTSRVLSLVAIVPSPRKRITADYEKRDEPITKKNKQGSSEYAASQMPGEENDVQRQT